MRLLAGCGDNLIHMWDIVNGKHLVCMVVLQITYISNYNVALLTGSNGGIYHMLLKSRIKLTKRESCIEDSTSLSFEEKTFVKYETKLFGVL